jgi:hypothetical protein
MTRDRKGTGLLCRDSEGIVGTNRPVLCGGRFATAA